MTRFVLGTSVALAESVLEMLSTGGSAIVPSIWPLEVTNALLSAERRGRVTTAYSTGFLERLIDLPISVDAAGSADVFRRVLPVATQYGLATYNAALLEVALREGLPLATLDGAMKRAASAMGIAPAGCPL